jgi:hypothetical protein
MTSNAKTQRDEDAPNLAAPKEAAMASDRSASKTGRPADRPDPDAFAADLLVSDKIILDHLAK